VVDGTWVGRRTRLVAVLSQVLYAYGLRDDGLAAAAFTYLMPVFTAFFAATS
jgi:hypothetical protein